MVPEISDLIVVEIPRQPAGVISALHRAGLVPRILSGTSAGSIVAAFVCVKTDDEMTEMLFDDPHQVCAGHSSKASALIKMRNALFWALFHASNMACMVPTQILMASSVSSTLLISSRRSPSLTSPAESLKLTSTTSQPTWRRPLPPPRPTHLCQRSQIARARLCFVKQRVL